MRARFQSWLEETHSPGFELVRHFLFGFFDSEAVPVSGQWQKMAYGILAVLLSAGILALKTYWQRYSILWERGTPELFRQAMREDELGFIALAMGVTAIITALQWQSLFPNRRDCLAFGGWPVSPRQIFAAKFGSLVLIFVVFVLALTAIPGVLLAVVTRYPWRPNPYLAANAVANIAAAAGACWFAFFGLLGVQGILLNLLPARTFARVSLFAQGVMFIGILGAMPLLGRWPTSAAWFPTSWLLALWESLLRGLPVPRSAILALTVPVVVTLLTYVLGYHRYRRLMVEGASPGHSARRWQGVGSRLLERWMSDPREQAVFAFAWKTLLRSRSHRLILLAYAGIGLGCITKGALDTPRPSLHDQGLYGFISVVAPLAIAIAMTAGLRYLFSLPVALPSNWLFRMTEPEDRAVWLFAVERFVVWCGIGPVFVAALPAAVAVFGWIRACGAAALALLAVLIVFEFLFRRWDKLPFTCGHLPPQESVYVIAGRVFYAIVYTTAVAQLILYCSGEPTAFVALVTFEAVIWQWLRRRRLANQAQAVISWEDQPEDAPILLGLSATIEDYDAPVESSAPAGAAPSMFSGSLVASRGILPASWQEEIDTERSHPAELAATFWEDVRYGLRVIRRNPMLSAIVVLTLTVGIGINATVFSVVNGLALRPHVYRDPGTFLQVIPQNQWQGRIRGVSYPEYVRMRDNVRSLRQLAAWTHFPALMGDEDSSGSFGLMVSCNFFPVEGLDHAILGRLLDAGDCGLGQVPPAVLAESVWRNRFGGDPELVGRTIQVNNRPVIVAGVVPDRTSGWTIPVKIWLPYTASAYFEPGAGYFQREDELWLSLAGRLAPGHSRSAAQAELNALAHQEDRMHPGRRTVVTTTDGSWIETLELTATGRDLMLIAFFLGAFVLVLFNACANVATLLLSRAAARRREIAVRLSLGAPRIRLVRMLVTESVLLASIAGALSLLIAWKLPQPLFRLVATGAPDFPMPTDWRIFLYLVMVVLATGILSGLAPAVESVKVDLLGGLKGYGGLASGARGTRIRGFLVSAQVALSMVLLVQAALFAQSENQTLRADPGYLADRVVVAPLSFPAGNTPQQTAARLRAISARILAIPGTHSVAFSEGLPMMSRQTVEIRPPARQDASQPVDVYAVSPGFLETMGIRLVRGRDVQDSDGTAVVVSQSLAGLFWRGQNAVGQSMPFPGGALNVVGVARDVAPLRFGGSDNPAVYCLRPINAQFNFMSVRFDSGATRGAPAVRAALRASDPDILVLARLLSAWFEKATTILWNVVDLIVILGLLATTLAAAGIYGAVSFSVGQQMRDLGVRAALGARRWHIVREVVRSAGRPVAAGLLQGLWMSVAVAANLRHNLSNSPIRLDTTNPVLYLSAAAVLAVAAAIAMIGPARRGCRCDPLQALRCE